MKGKKICIALLIFFTTCLLSLSLFSNANAIEKRKNVQNRYINSIQWYYQGRDDTGANASGEMSGNLINVSVYDHITLFANPQQASQLTNLRLNLRENITLSKNKYFKVSIYYLIKADLDRSTLSIPLCPRGQSYLVVDECNITHIEEENEIYKIKEKILNPSDNMYYYQVFNNVQYYYVMELVGHYEGNETTLSQLAFYNNFYTYYNSFPYLDSVEVILYFSPVEQFEYVESATEQEQQQELEDRDNLESQSASTDNEASTAGQSAANTGTTLFGAFTQLFNALTNVSGSSCTLPNMQIYSLDLGQLDLCTYTIPPQIMALVSIGMVFIIVPLGIHLVKKMINLYKEITG